MRLFLSLFLLVAGVSFALAQTCPPESEVSKILKHQLNSVEKAAVSPNENDFEAALQINARVFRILPRGTFDYEKNPFSVRGGGAYYSFVKQSHSYNDTPQIELQQNNLSVGFYGANYGFIADLGNVPLSEITRESENLRFLLNYNPVVLESEARNEYKKISRGFEVEGVKYKNSLPAVAGHSYVLRAISYDEADTLVALRIFRQDADGSLIVFWKFIENFQPPVLTRNR
jgi:hypothetical protein